MMESLDQEQRLCEVRALLRDEYGFSTKECRPLGDDTVSSSVFLAELEDGRKVVIKQSLWYLGHASDPSEVLECVYDVGNRLADKGIPLCRAYQTKRGTCTVLRRSVPWVVLEFIAGSHFSGASVEWQVAGAGLARFHKIGKILLTEDTRLEDDIRTSIPVEKSYEESRAMYEEIRTNILASDATSPDALRVLKKEIGVIDDVVTYIDRTLQRAQLSRGILHNDFNAVNIVFNADGSLNGFIDFDQLAVDPFIYDIANGLAAFATDYLKSHTQAEFEASTALFLRAYHTQMQLSLEEYQYILVATQRWDVMRILRIVRRHFDGGHPFPNPLDKITKRFLPRIKRSPHTFSFLSTEWIGQNIY